MPEIDGEKLVWVTSRFFSRSHFVQMEVNIPGVIRGLRSAFSYMFLV